MDDFEATQVLDAIKVLKAEVKGLKERTDLMLHMIIHFHPEVMDGFDDWQKENPDG